MSRGINNQNVVYPEESTTTRTYTISAQQGEGTVYDFGASDIELQINGTIMKTHEHRLNNFSGLKQLIENLRSSSDTSQRLSISLYGDEGLVDDFLGMFKILYASVIEGPFEFDAKTIISGLRIASAYDHPSLRTFCLRKLLDNGTLTPIQQLQVSREFGLEAWEKSAFRELCGRKDPITQQEAKIMGIDTFVQVASAREKLQLEKSNIGFSAGTNSRGTHVHIQELATRTQPAAVIGLLFGHST